MLDNKPSVKTLVSQQRTRIFKTLCCETTTSRLEPPANAKTTTGIKPLSARVSRDVAPSRLAKSWLAQMATVDKRVSVARRRHRSHATASN